MDEVWKLEEMSQSQIDFGDAGPSSDVSIGFEVHVLRSLHPISHTSHFILHTLQPTCSVNSRRTCVLLHVERSSIFPLEVEVGPSPRRLRPPNNTSSTTLWPRFDPMFNCREFPNLSAQWSRTESRKRYPNVRKSCS